MDEWHLRVLVLGDVTGRERGREFLPRLAVSPSPSDQHFCSPNYQLHIADVSLQSTLGSMMAGRRLIWLVMIASLMAAPTTWADRWYEHYARAEAALTAKDHQNAIDELNQALERRGDSGARVRTYGMRVTAYFPYLKLGIAYFQAGEYQASLRAFETEEQLGAIEASDQALAELSRYRQLAIDALNKQQADQIRVVDELVQQSLAEARALQRRGQLDQALAAVGRALSLVPESAEANELATALREELTRRTTEQAHQDRSIQLIEEGQQLRSEGLLADAAARFRQAIELAPGSGGQGLLAEVQTELARRNAEVSSFQPADTLRRAKNLLTAGELEAALSQVQEVIATAQNNQEAVDLERQILALIAEESRTDEIRRLLADAEARLAEGDHEGAIAAANLVLARDQSHAGALRLIRLAYGALSRTLLGGGSTQNLPPAIRFADMRTEGADGSPIHIVSEPEFRLSGVVIDESEVSLEVTDGSGSEVSSEVSSQNLGGIQITEFRLSTVAPVGRTTFIVVATDRQGLSSRSEYEVEYRRPLTQSPWLWIALVLIPLFLAAIMMIRQLIRRRNLLRRRFNPYVAGPPVLDPELFFGRDALLDRVLATVPNNSLLLLGERRIGKTSLLHQLRSRLRDLEHPSYCFVPVSIDLQGVPETAFFGTVAEAIGETIGDPRMADARADDDYDSRELIRDLRRVLPSIDCPDGKRVKLVLLLDEIDELNGYSYRTNQRLRSLFMRGFADQLVAVAAGVGIAREWDHEGSPWYNFFEEMEVGPVSVDAARCLVMEPLNGVLAFDQEALKLVLQEAQGRPYLLQKIALAVVQYLHEAGRRRITADDVNVVLSKSNNSRNRANRSLV